MCLIAVRLVGVALPQLDNKMQDTWLANYEKRQQRLPSLLKYTHTHAHTST